MTRMLRAGGGRRRGMSIVELLVVTGLIGSLMGLILVGLRPGKSSEQKRVADDLASALMAAQARGLGVPEGAAVIIEPESANSSITICDAIVQPLAEGQATGIPPANPASATATVNLDLANADEVMGGYKILFFRAEDNPGVMPPSAWLQFTASSGSAGTVTWRSGAGQTAGNTVWPKSSGQPLDALVARVPLKSSVLLEVADGVAIDLRFSGVGDDRTTPYGRLDNKGSIAVLFDRVGRVGEVMQQLPPPGSAAALTVQPLVPAGIIYFLIAPRSDVQEGRNTLDSAESAWVAVSPQTGRVIVAANVPQSSMTDAAVRAARANARRGIPIGK